MLNFQISLILNRKSFVRRPGVRDSIVLLCFTSTRPISCYCFYCMVRVARGKTTLLKSASIFALSMASSPSTLMKRDQCASIQFHGGIDAKLRSGYRRCIFLSGETGCKARIVYWYIWKIISGLMAGWDKVFCPNCLRISFTVIMGRNAPSIAWTIDPGWKKYMRSIQVRNLSRMKLMFFTQA